MEEENVDLTIKSLVWYLLNIRNLYTLMLCIFYYSFKFNLKFMILIDCLTKFVFMKVILSFAVEFNCYCNYFF